MQSDFSFYPVSSAAALPGKFAKLRNKRSRRRLHIKHNNTHISEMLLKSSFSSNIYLTYNCNRKRCQITIPGGIRGCNRHHLPLRGTLCPLVKHQSSAPSDSSNNRVASSAPWSFELKAAARLQTADGSTIPPPPDSFLTQLSVCGHNQ